MRFAFTRFFLQWLPSFCSFRPVMSSRGETGVFLPGFNIPMPPTCASRQLFNIECPGCGMTRAFISISHGQFARAWHFNPASFLVYLFVAAQIPWHAIQIWRLRANQRPLYWTLDLLHPNHHLDRDAHQLELETLLMNFTTVETKNASPQCFRQRHRATDFVCAWIST